MTNMVGYTRTVYPAGTTLQPVPGGVNGSSGSGGSSAQGVGYDGPNDLIDLEEPIIRSIIDRLPIGPRWQC